MSICRNTRRHLDITARIHDTVTPADRARMVAEQRAELEIDLADGEIDQAFLDRWSARHPEATS